MGGQRHSPTALPLWKTRYTLYRRLCRPLGQSPQKRRISPPPPRAGFDPLTVQPVASRYTDCAPGYPLAEFVSAPCRQIGRAGRSLVAVPTEPSQNINTRNCLHTFTDAHNRIHGSAKSCTDEPCGSVASHRIQWRGWTHQQHNPHLFTGAVNFTVDKTSSVHDGLQHTYVEGLFFVHKHPRAEHAGTSNKMATKKQTGNLMADRKGWRQNKVTAFITESAGTEIHPKITQPCRVYNCRMTRTGPNVTLR